MVFLNELVNFIPRAFEWNEKTEKYDSIPGSGYCPVCGSLVCIDAPDCNICDECGTEYFDSGEPMTPRCQWED